jgi:glycosyltransferase involved in cell wall biosynthesis
MRLGLIARNDLSGLAIQCWEFYQHMHPDKVMLIDVSMYANEGEDCNKFPCATHHYPNPDVIVNGWEPTIAQFEQFLDGLDAVYTAETPYGWDLIRLAQQRGVRTYVHVNPEFCQHLAVPTLIKPTLLMNPTEWMHDQLPQPKQVVPFPVATERFNTVGKDSDWFNIPAKNFLHIVGRPAAYDRNGTLELLTALQYVTKPINLMISCLQAGYVIDAIRPVKIPGHVTIDINEMQYPEYWSIYKNQDVMIMPRRWGGMSLPIQEAMAAGLPVIMAANDVYSPQCPPEWSVAAWHDTWFQARTRIDVYKANPANLAHCIDTFASDPVMTVHGRERALQWAQMHSWRRLKPRYDELLAG